MKKVAAAWTALIVLCSAPVVLAQAAGKDGGSVEETEEGIPVTDQLTIEKCGGCHARDEKGNLSRISWARTTPEAWSQAIKRMVRLNGLQLSGEEARSIVKYLGTRHGLAPEEAKPVMYMVEHRIIDEDIPNDDIRQACSACHGFGQPMSWRRSKAEWQLLQNLHVAMFSQADAQFRTPATRAPGAAPLPVGLRPAFDLLDSVCAEQALMLRLEPRPGDLLLFNPHLVWKLRTLVEAAPDAPDAPQEFRRLRVTMAHSRRTVAEPG